MRIKGALFDLDGVVVDTEAEYSEFWNAQGKKYLPGIPNFADGIKGNTLVQVFEKFFPEEKTRNEITESLDIFEAGMKYPSIPGAEKFIRNLREAGVKTALVTSSNNKKMQSLFKNRPEIQELFDIVLTSESVARSKPDPEGYLRAAKELGFDVCECVVFEDSYAGLEAGRRSGMPLVGLATTYSESVVRPLADVVIPNFEGVCAEILKSASAACNSRQA